MLRCWVSDNVIVMAVRDRASESERDDVGVGVSVSVQLWCWLSDCVADTALDTDLETVSVEDEDFVKERETVAVALCCCAETLSVEERDSDTEGVVEIDAVSDASRLKLSVKLPDGDFRDSESWAVADSDVDGVTRDRVGDSSGVTVALCSDSDTVVMFAVCVGVGELVKLSDPVLEDDLVRVGS